MVMQPNPTRFVFDTSGLYGTLDPKRGRSPRYIKPGLLGRLALKGRVALPKQVADEASRTEIAAVRDFIAKRAADVEYDRDLEARKHEAAVRAICDNLRDFIDSGSDVAILCTTLALIERSRANDSGIDYCIVLEDISFAAACTLCGVSAIPSRVFVALIGAINLRELPVLS